MEGFNIILNNITILALVMAVGYISVKTGYISEDVKNALSKVITRITLPLLVITSLTKVELDAEKMVNSIIVVGIALMTIFVMYVIGMIFAKVFKLSKQTAIVHQCMSAFGNVIFLGYPLILALFGSEGLFYAALYSVANDAFVWTLGVYQLSTINENEKISKSEKLKNLCNPATIAFALSFIMMIFRWKFTGVIEQVFNGIGGTTTYLSMIFIGGTLALVDLKSLFKRVSIFLMATVKMIAIPIIMIIILRFIPIDIMLKYILVLQIGMPSQTLIAIITTEYGGDVLYAAEGIFITTIFSLVTLPFLYYMMTVIW